MLMENIATTPAAKKILVVDDNQVVLNAMHFLLRKHGYEAVLAETGAAALTIIRHDHPDLILLDLDLPDTSIVSNAMSDGFNMMDWARRMGAAEKIPIIILSGLDPAVYQARAEAAGIANFFQKPVDNEKLLAAIQLLLGPAPAKPAA